MKLNLNAILISFFIFFLFGCLESPEDRTIRIATEQMGDYLNYSDGMDNYDLTCIERLQINGCLNENPNETKEGCEWIISMRNTPSRKYWLDYPQCLKGSDFLKCTPSHACKSPTCDSPEDIEWERACGFRK